MIREGYRMNGWCYLKIRKGRVRFRVPGPIWQTAKVFSDETGGQHDGKLCVIFSG
jgi:hypothetical protein